MSITSFKNIMIAKYPNNTTAIFIGVIHNQINLSNNNIDLIINLLSMGKYNGRKTELWVEHNNDMTCKEIVDSYNKIKNNKMVDIVRDNTTMELIFKLNGCNRKNMIRGWDKRWQLSIKQNDGTIYDVQQNLYNSKITDIFTLNDLYNILIAQLPDETVKKTLLTSLLNLNNYDRNIIIDNIPKITPSDKKSINNMIKILRKQFAIWADKEVHEKLLNNKNKIIFIIQGLNHFKHFYFLIKSGNIESIIKSEININDI